MISKLFTKRSLALSVAFVVVSATYLLLGPGSVFAIEDKPEDINKAIAAAAGLNGASAIKDRIDSCNGKVYLESNGREKCVIENCTLMKTRQYRDMCMYSGFLTGSGNTNCSLKLPGPTNAKGDPPGYLNCIVAQRATCNSLGSYLYKGASPKSFCLTAATWVSSKYYSSANSKPVSEGGVTNQQAYDEYGDFVKGKLSPTDELIFIDKVFKGGPLAPAPVDEAPPNDADADGDGVPDDKDKSTLECDLDDSGSIDTKDDKDCIKKAFNDVEAVPESLKCKNGTGIQISTPINGNKCIGVSQNGGIADNPIINILRIVIKVAAAGVGLVVAAMIVVAGIQYSTSQGNPQRTVAAKQRLINAIIGLIMFIFATVILNYVVPGGIIGGV